MSKCICKGNWREIVEEYEHLIGTIFTDTLRQEDFVFFGIVHGADDYYYGMRSLADGKLRLLSCVGSIEGHDFVPRV